MDKHEALQELVSIREQMAELILQAERIMMTEFPVEFQSAKPYWINHIRGAIGDMGYDGSYSINMFDTLQEIETTNLDAE